MRKSQIFKILTHLSLSLIFCFNWVFFAFALALKKADVPIGGSVSYEVPIPDVSEFNWSIYYYSDGIAVIESDSLSGDVIIPPKVSKNGEVYTVTRIKWDCVVNTRLTSVVIPSTVTDVCFEQCQNLSRVTFKEGIQLESLYRSFWFCHSLVSINIPNSVTEITAAFCECTSLLSINIPASVVEIGYSAFSYCYSLPSINIPASVVEIGSNAFYNDTNLATVFIDSDTISSSLTEEDSCGYLIQYATTIYIKEGCGVGSYVTENFTQETSDQSGYVKYIKNQ